MYGPLIVKPIKSKGDKTGAWRLKLRPKFLQKNCVGCRMCMTICPEACIKGKEKNTFTCDYNYCKGCGFCALVCPKADIVMIEEAQEAEGEKK
jgi:pyruvate ferredoxin oxidoreductase delta subunit